MAEERVQRRLAAILAADVVGYSRLMGADEAGTRARFNAHLHELIEPAIASRRGRIVKTTGDALLIEFASVVDAVQCAVEIQKSMAERNGDEPDDRRMDFRIGVNLGDVIIEGDDIHGDGVNVAARLEGLAEPGSVVVSGKVHEEVRTKLDLGFDDLGSQKVKNIAEPVHAFSVGLGKAVNSMGKPEAPTSLPLPDKPSIAVLPFENMSADPEQEYFADGIAEDIITALSRFSWFFVIARNSSFTYKGEAVDVKQVARELGVQYVLEGSVRKAGSRVRITAQLIDALTGRHVWADRYDHDLDDIFAVQDEITEAITGAVAPAFVSAEAGRARDKLPENLDAWDFAMRGNWHFWRLNKKDISEAKRLFQASIDLEPRNSMAISGLAIACSWEVIWGWAEDPAENRATAYRLAQQSVTVDANDAWAHAVLGHVSSHRRQLDAAISACQRALDLNTSLAFAEATLAESYAGLGDYDEAMLHADRAARLSPRDPAKAWWTIPRMVAAFVVGRYEEQVRWAKMMTEATPDHPGGWRWLAAAYGHLDRLDEAQAAVQQLLRLVPHYSIGLVRAAVPILQPEDLERYIDGLRKAGLPE